MVYIIMLNFLHQILEVRKGCNIVEKIVKETLVHIITNTHFIYL